MTHAVFKLEDSFVESYATRDPPFDVIGFITYVRTYAREKESGQLERWHETVRRVVEGTYEIQRRHVMASGVAWDTNKAQVSANEMYDLVYNMKFTPPGRGLWAMGTKIISERGLYTTLNNCAMISTSTIDKDFAAPFTFLMDVSMLGVGCGFDVLGANKVALTRPMLTKVVSAGAMYLHCANLLPIINFIQTSIDNMTTELNACSNNWKRDAIIADIQLYKAECEYINSVGMVARDQIGAEIHKIADTREGWVESVSRLLNSFVGLNMPVIFDYSLIRPAGAKLKTFGGISSGPSALFELHCNIACQKCILGRQSHYYHHHYGYYEYGWQMRYCGQCAPQ
jgi:ribonucleotide reductase alpha subunit